MKKLNYLERVRREAGLTLREVFVLSKEKYPNDKQKWISAGLLSKVEGCASILNLSVKRLETLASIYSIKPIEILKGYGL